MTGLKAQLLDALRGIAGVEVQPSPVAGGTALFRAGKTFAHFHNDNELDLRLTRKHIRALGLSHPAGSLHHARRSANSPWIELRFHQPADIERICALVRLALAAL